MSVTPEHGAGLCLKFAVISIRLLWNRSTAVKVPASVTKRPTSSNLNGCDGMRGRLLMTVVVEWCQALSQLIHMMVPSSVTKHVVPGSVTGMYGTQTPVPGSVRQLDNKGDVPYLKYRCQALSQHMRCRALSETMSDLGVRPPSQAT